VLFTRGISLSWDTRQNSESVVGVPIVGREWPTAFPPKTAGRFSTVPALQNLHKDYFADTMKTEMLCKELEIKQFRIVSPETPR
jgi:hypothetical protein